MSATQPIIERILADARKEAEQILLAERQSTQEALQDANAEVSSLLQDSREKAKRDAEDLIRRRRTLAALEVKKIALFGRRQALDTAFETALKQLCALPAAEYGELVKTLIEAYSEYGDEIVISKHSPVERSFIMAIPIYGDKKLKLSSKGGNFAGGLILVGETYDKQLTFETLLAQARTDMETEVAEILGE